MPHADVLLELLANPLRRVIRTREKLLAVTGNTRRARLIARGMALTSAHPLTWDQVSLMLAAEEKVEGMPPRP
jgi:hypothetical protein